MSMQIMNDDLLASHLFSAHWAWLLCEHWNANLHWHASMAGAGEIGFALELPDELRTLVLCWDDKGSMIAAAPKAAHRPEFCGPLEHWAAVMRAEVSPAGAVLRGQLTYNGPLWFAAKYANAFKNIVQAQRQALDRPKEAVPCLNLHMHDLSRMRDSHE